MIFRQKTYAPASAILPVCGLSYAKFARTAAIKSWTEGVFVRAGSIEKPVGNY